MSYLVSAADLKNIRFSEADTVSSVLQNVAVILATRKGTVPLYRDFGLSWDMVDLPVPAAKAALRTEVREAVERWEPRATVLGVDFLDSAGGPGVLHPIVEVEINNEDIF